LGELLDYEVQVEDEILRVRMGPGSPILENERVGLSIEGKAVAVPAE
jgi:hypothetical protein